MLKLACALALLSSSLAFAAPDWATARRNPSVGENSAGHPFAGGLLAVSSLDHNGGTGMGFGAEGGYYLNQNWGIGAFLRSANHDNTVTSFFVAAEGLRRLDFLFPGLQVGGILGSGHNSFNGESGRVGLAFGAKASLDYPISVHFPVTLAADLSVIYYEPGPSLLRNVTPSALIKYWF